MPESSAPEHGIAEGRIRWSVVGVGIAGRMRARAILADPRSALVAAHRGRFADELPCAQLERLEDAIAAADAVAICSPSAQHARQVAAVLEAGRHAVVEFPVAGGAGAAAALFDTARRVDRVLHVEHIELLSATAAALRERIDRGALRGVSASFQSAGTEDLPGRELALRGVARLHRIVDIAGPLARVDAVRARPGQLGAELRTTTGLPVALQLRVGPGLDRRTRMVVDDGREWVQEGRALSVDGRPLDLPGVEGLFAADHQVAVERILDGGEHYLSEERILHVLEVVDMLRGGRRGHLPFRIH